MTDIIRYQKKYLEKTSQQCQGLPAITLQLYSLESELLEIYHLRKRSIKNFHLLWIQHIC